MRVLLIDDDEEDFVLVRDMLEEADPRAYTIEWAGTFEDGLRAVGNERHDAYLVDFRLGARTGLDLLDATRGQSPFAARIFLTRRGNPDIDRRAMQAGVHDYLAKDEMTPALLERTVRYTVRNCRTLQSLEESRQRHALALEGAKDGIWDWDLTTNVVHYSKRWKTMLGCREDAVGTSPTEWFGRIHEGDRDRVLRSIATHLEDAMPYFETEHRIRAADGTHRWVLTRGLAVRDRDGRATRMAGSQSDITERRSAQDALLSHVSHELRTPLAAMHQFAIILEEEIGGPLTDAQRDYVSTIIRNVDQLNRMIVDLMDVTRIDRGTLPVTPVPTAVGTILDDVVRVMRVRASAAGLRFAVTMDPSLPDVLADPDRLRQVLINLVENAVKFTPEGGLVSVRVQRHPIDMGYVHLAVSDTGVGIPPEALDVVFERFQQGAASGEASRKGLGLGLYLSREVITRQGGQIWAQSRLGEGTTFHVMLPVEATEQDSTQRSETPSLRALRSTTRGPVGPASSQEVADGTEASVDRR